MSKFFKENNIRGARWARAICSFWKIYKCLLHQITREIFLELVDDVHEIASQRVEIVEILKARTRYL